MCMLKINEKLLPNVELIVGGSAVKTGRKIGNKDEYVQRFNCGNGPAKNGEKSFATGLSNVTVHNFNGVLTDNNWIWNLLNPHMRTRYRYSNNTFYFNELNYETLANFTIILDVYFTYN